jgi:hypothetical protein
MTVDRTTSLAVALVPWGIVGCMSDSLVQQAHEPAIMIYLQCFSHSAGKQHLHRPISAAAYVTAIQSPQYTSMEQTGGYLFEMVASIAACSCSRSSQHLRIPCGARSRIHHQRLLARVHSGSAAWATDNPRGHSRAVRCISCSLSRQMRSVQ